MKVGDIVHCDYGFGFVMAKAFEHDGPLFRIVFGRFPEQRMWFRPWELKVVSDENR